jgi:hypothetical protein
MAEERIHKAVATHINLEIIYCNMQRCNGGSFVEFAIQMAFTRMFYVIFGMLAVATAPLALKT